VFFLAKFINFHNAEKQGFWVEVSSQVVNGKYTHFRSPVGRLFRSAIALFTATGVGFIPFRAVDTYRECERLMPCSNLLNACRDMQHLVFQTQDSPAAQGAWYTPPFG